MCSSDLKKKDKVEIGDKQLEFEKSDKNSDELNKIKREGAILRGVPKERDKVEIKNIKIINYSNQEVIPEYLSLNVTYLENNSWAYKREMLPLKEVRP